MYPWVTGLVYCLKSQNSLDLENILKIISSFLELFNINNI